MGIFRRGARDEAQFPAPADTAPIGSAGPRRHIRVCGEVSRLRVTPARGVPSLCVQVSDGTGTVVAVWTGRRSLGGVSLGRRIILEGVAAESPDGLTFMNPAYELL